MTCLRRVYVCVVMQCPVQVVLGQRYRHLECSSPVGVLRRRTDAVALLGRRAASTLQQRASVWSRRTVPLSARRRHRKTPCSRSVSQLPFDVCDRRLFVDSFVLFTQFLY